MWQEEDRQNQQTHSNSDVTNGAAGVQKHSLESLSTALMEANTFGLSVSNSVLLIVPFRDVIRHNPIYKLIAKLRRTVELSVQRAGNIGLC